MSKLLDSHSPVSVAGAGHDGSLDDLEEGTMVVMYFSPGVLVVVRPTGKYWELEALSIPEDTETTALYFFPSESVFTVVRKGRYVGFKSVTAEGRTLQAIDGEESVPLRISNYNFGTWEMWEATASGFVNRKWPQKSLGLDVREVQNVSLENLRNLETYTLKASRDMQTQIKSLKGHQQKLEREIGELNKSKRRQANQHARELEDHRSRLNEALATKQKLEIEEVHTGTKLRRQELIVTQLTRQRDNANARVREIEAYLKVNEIELEEMRQSKEIELEAMRQSKARGLEAMRQSKESELEAMRQSTENELEAMRQSKESELEAMRQSKESELEAMRQSKESELEAMRQSKENELEAMREKFERQIDDLKRSQQNVATETKRRSQATLPKEQTPKQNQIRTLRVQGQWPKLTRTKLKPTV